MSDETRRTVERIILKEIAREQEMPEEIFNMMDIFVKNGCELKAVMLSMSEFGEYLMKKHEEEQKIDKDALKELLKDLPIKWEDE